MTLFASIRRSAALLLIGGCKNAIVTVNATNRLKKVNAIDAGVPYSWGTFTIPGGLLNK